MFVEIFSLQTVDFLKHNPILTHPFVDFLVKQLLGQILKQKITVEINCNNFLFVTYSFSESTNLFLGRSSEVHWGITSISSDWGGQGRSGAGDWGVLGVVVVGGVVGAGVGALHCKFGATPSLW